MEALKQNWTRSTPESIKYGDEVLFKYSSNETIHGKVEVSSKSYLVIKLLDLVKGGYFQKQISDEMTIYKQHITKIGIKN